MPTPINGQCGDNSPIYRSFYSDNVADANHRFTMDLTAHVRMIKRGDVLEGVVMCAPVTSEEAEADVVRFLEQATLGPTEALVQEVKTKGIAAWIDEQIPLNVTRYTQLPYLDQGASITTCVDDKSLPWTPEKCCETNRKSHQSIAWEFFRQAKPAPDQLRLRMAHVWHQIFVVERWRHCLFGGGVSAALSRPRVRHFREPAGQIHAVTASRHLSELGAKRTRASTASSRTRITRAS